MPTFAEAFRLQAVSDLDAYEALVPTAVPVCHRLHYLQMWPRNFVRLTCGDPEPPRSNFALVQVVGAVLPRLIGEKWRRLEAFIQPPPMLAIRALCRQVDLLHPQVDDGGRRPDNVEYPWDVNGVSYVPAEFKFALSGDLYKNPGPAVLKAAVQLTRDPVLLLA
jgi:hypothetical protein